MKSSRLPVFEHKPHKACKESIQKMSDSTSGYWLVGYVTMPDDT